MLQIRADRSRRPTATLDPADPVAFVDGLAPHDIRLLAGLDALGLGDALARAAPARPVLWFDLGPSGSTARLIETAIAQLARSVAGLWPFLWGGEDFSATRDDALGRAHLPIRLAALARRWPAVSQAWANDIVLRLLRDAPPRRHDAAPEIEWAQLALAYAPDGFVLATALGSGPAREGEVRALEWLAQHAAVSVVVIADTLPDEPACERILYGARHVARPGPRTPDVAADTPEREPANEPRVLALPETEGRPHPQSPTEMRLYQLLQADDDLRPLFAFNMTVPGLNLLTARADLIWRDGRVVVEIDGPEHRGAAKYRADRHRDYELMCAGYRVLRMTNEEIAEDAGRAIAKIRTVVRLGKEGG